VKFHAQKQIGKRHVIDIFTSEDMENISLFIFQYLTLNYRAFAPRDQLNKSLGGHVGVPEKRV
jgi:hypothetical protein